MVIAPLSIREDYWDTFDIRDEDLEFLYNHLLEVEIPQTPQELTEALVNDRINKEKQNLEDQQKMGGSIYFPKDHYEVGQTLIFPAIEWKKGTVIGLRQGHNPDYPTLDVLKIKFDDGQVKEFAAGIEDHVLNEPVGFEIDTKLLQPDYVISKFGGSLTKKLVQTLETNPDLIRIAGRWFPRALIVDINLGNLNLAEAVLDMAGGGPLSTRSIIEQIELPVDTNSKLTEFSLNFALQEDSRFDEVGPSGEVLWFLKKLEPDQVQQPPNYLEYQPETYDRSALSDDMFLLEIEIDDELSPDEGNDNDVEETAVVSIIYPHWRSGTLPLTKRTQDLFPTAYEAPRIQFTFVDGDSGEKFPAWVVRSGRYIYGLEKWYRSLDLIPGSSINISRSKIPGEVIIRAEKRRSTRDWLKTLLVGADGGIVFAMLKQNITAAYDERMAIAIPDIDSLDKIWDHTSKHTPPLAQTVIKMMRELAKLNPQGHVHAKEIYAAVNILRRCPPGPILSLLATQPWFIHLGDLHFRLDDTKLQEERG